MALLPCFHMLLVRAALRARLRLRIMGSVAGLVALLTGLRMLLLCCARL